ncbi:hypothetical protein NDU88_005938 [Pleurodeles waltl]|uniref:Uncharacterized protein n=1 Tax=Pleurodeles waltl TaxID=8319 RepID=A0AAV7UJG5_PLEWA|nr:hypothetical protein NDU88_005938 [Pleurodeles waltl]
MSVVITSRSIPSQRGITHTRRTSSFTGPLRQGAETGDGHRPSVGTSPGRVLGSLPLGATPCDALLLAGVYALATTLLRALGST